jgi:hypothetical protein
VQREFCEVVLQPQQRNCRPAFAVAEQSGVSLRLYHVFIPKKPQLLSHFLGACKAAVKALIMPFFAAILKDGVV